MADERAHDLIMGSRWGAPVANNGADPRTRALRVLRKYISELTFYRDMGEGEEPQPFSLDVSAIYIGVPEISQDVVLPSMVMMPGEERYEGFGLQPQVIESTMDVFGLGTVLLHHYTQVEEITLEMWSGKKPERSAMVAGLQRAFMPSDEYYGLRFRVPDYYDQPVIFTPLSNTRPDDGAVRMQREAMMKVEYRLEIVSLVNCETLKPASEIGTYESSDIRAHECGELQAEGYTEGDPPQPKTPNGWNPVPSIPFNLSEWWSNAALYKWFPFSRRSR